MATSSTRTSSWARSRQHDIPSFTVEALPVETFEAMLVVAGWLGEVIDDDPPYRLDVHMTDPFECWCRFDVVPDAGASTVSLTVGSWAGSPVAPVEQVPRRVGRRAEPSRLDGAQRRGAAALRSRSRTAWPRPAAGGSRAMTHDAPASSAARNDE